MRNLDKENKKTALGNGQTTMVGTGRKREGTSGPPSFLFLIAQGAQSIKRRRFTYVPPEHCQF
jgi:hypothetical protein